MKKKEKKKRKAEVILRIYQCQNKILNCDAGDDCVINCNASYACDGATINCPINGKCNIFCWGGLFGCKETTINALTANDLDLICNNYLLNLKH